MLTQFNSNAVEKQIDIINAYYEFNDSNFVYISIKQT